MLRILGAGLGLGLPLAQIARAAAQTAAPVATPLPRTPTPVATPPAPVPAPAPAWLQALRPIALWSGPDDAAIQFGVAARWDYFQIARPQQGPRILVLVARSRNYAWVDALSVGPSGPPPPGWPPADQPAPPRDLSLGWVATVADATIWASPTDDLPLGIVPAWTTFTQLDPQNGTRIHVLDPYSGGDSYVNAADVGPVGAPEKTPSPRRWWGAVAVDGANLRPAPDTRTEPLGQLPWGSPVVVDAWVVGEEVIPDNPTWARLAEGVFFYSSVLRPIALPVTPPPPPEAVGEPGRWVDLNLTLQVVIAYEGETPVYVARTSSGRPGWETPAGIFRIGRRVEKETMDSNTLIGLDARRADYKVENVRWTQYFTPDGVAFHENYWKPRDQFGIPSSHGCPGLVAEDARFLWDWAEIGTPVYAHL